MIRIHCDAADAILKETQTLTSGMLNYPTVVLTFSSDWNGFAKAAVVRAGETVVDVLITNNKFVVPAECLAEAGVNLIVGISGTNGTAVIPTIWCSCGEILVGTDVNEGENLGTATPELVQQMLDYAGEIEDYAEELDKSVIRDVEYITTHVREYGTPTVTVTDSGAGSNRTLTFTFAYLRGNGIDEITFISSGENKGQVQITLNDREVITYDGIKDALAYIASEESSIASAEELRVIAENLRVAAEAARAQAENTRETTFASWEPRIDNAEAWAVGQRNGADVGSTDPTYHNNAKYYAEIASLPNNKLFWCDYGTTTYDEITEAINNGCLPVVYLWNGQGGMQETILVCTGHTLMSAISPYDPSATTFYNRYHFYAKGDGTETTVTCTKLTGAETSAGIWNVNSTRQINSKTYYNTVTKKLRNIDGGTETDVVTVAQLKTDMDLTAGDSSYDSSTTYANGTVGAALSSILNRLDALET